MDDRLRLAYATAVKAAREAGTRVEVHLGSDVIKYMRTLGNVPDSDLFPIRTVWGFPIVVADDPDTIAVHSVTSIY